jgi:hypothetical protein
MGENICIRCGKPRVVGKIWKEKIAIYGSNSLIEHTDWVCSDKECQKLVEKELAQRHQNTLKIEKAKFDRETEHKRKMVDLRLSRAKKV